MNVPGDFQQSITFAQAAATSDGALTGTPLDGSLLWLILTGQVVPDA
jgi:hypothetical protein